MPPRERYQYDSASEYETEAEVDFQETDTVKKAKKPYKKRRAFSEQRKLQRWDADKDQLLLLVADNVMAAIGSPLPWDVIAKHLSPNISGESIKQHLTKVLKTREAAGLPVPTKLAKGSQKKDHDQVEANLAYLASKAKDNSLSDKDAGFVPRDADGRNFNASWFDEMTPVKNAGLLHLPFQNPSKSTKREVDTVETPVKPFRSQVVPATPTLEPIRRFLQPVTPVMSSLQIDEALARERAQPQTSSDSRTMAVVERKKAPAQLSGSSDDVFVGPSTKKSTSQKAIAKASVPKKAITEKPAVEKPPTGTKRARKPKPSEHGEDAEYEESPKKQKRGLRKKAQISYNEQASPESGDGGFDDNITAAQGATNVYARQPILGVVGDNVIDGADIQDHQSMPGFPEDFGHMSAVPRTLRSEDWLLAFQQYPDFDLVNTGFQQHGNAFEANVMGFPTAQSGLSKNPNGVDLQYGSADCTPRRAASSTLQNFGYASQHGLPVSDYIGSPQHYSYTMAAGNSFNHGQSFDSNSSGSGFIDTHFSAPNSNSFSTNDSNFSAGDVPLPGLGHLDEPLSQFPSFTGGGSFSNSQNSVDTAQEEPSLAKSNDFDFLWGNEPQTVSGPDDFNFSDLLTEDCK